MSGNQLDQKSKAWSALFSEPMSALVQRYTASVDFDQRLWRADIAGSLAHAEMLATQGIIGADDHAARLGGLLNMTGFASGQLIGDEVAKLASSIGSTAR
mgnify:CR=1 FL=1